MREKELGDEQVRVTVRLPQGLYDAVRATRRQRWGWGAWNISLIIRDALQHYLTLQHRLANISPDLGIQRIDGGSKLTITTDRARRDMIFRRQLLNSTARNVIIIGTFFRPSLALHTRQQEPGCCESRGNERGRKQQSSKSGWHKTS